MEESSERLQKLVAQVRQRFQVYLDKSTPYIAYRWTSLATLLLVYFLRVYFLEGFYIVTYGLGIFNLNLLLAFISPQVDPESEGMELPTTSTDEFKPFSRRLPEFKFWYACIRSVFIGTVMTFFRIFDVPVFWPILLVYWLVLFTVTMKRQIRHMIKYRYFPISFGKKVRTWYHRLQLKECLVDIRSLYDLETGEMTIAVDEVFGQERGFIGKGDLVSCALA